MGGVPAYAAVSQSVELAKTLRGARGAHGFVNGVLQNLRRRGGALTFPDVASDPVGYLGSWGSHPEWIVRRWIERYGVAEATALVEMNNRRPELYLRVVGITAAEALERLMAAGIEAESVPFSPDSLMLKDAARIADAFAAAPVAVQDPAAALVVTAATFDPDTLVADLCASPGGKTLGIAGGSGRFVLAADLSAERLARLRQNVERLAPLPVGIIVADARRPPLRQAEQVLVDAPCTGTGTLRRHPDGRWRIDERALQSLAVLQAELLTAAAALIPPGGLLVYSTCSLEPEENEHQVEAFLQAHSGFRLEPVEGVDPGAVNAAGMLSVQPQAFGVDGAFAARLRRVA
jgi:16S rRNA (cytosine967-C5)-methyltransferase